MSPKAGLGKSLDLNETVLLHAEHLANFKVVILLLLLMIFLIFVPLFWRIYGPCFVTQ